MTDQKSTPFVFAAPNAIFTNADGYKKFMQAMCGTTDEEELLIERWEKMAAEAGERRDMASARQAFLRLKNSCVFVHVMTGPANRPCSLGDTRIEMAIHLKKPTVLVADEGEDWEASLASWRTKGLDIRKVWRVPPGTEEVPPELGPWCKQLVADEAKKLGKPVLPHGWGEDHTPVGTMDRRDQAPSAPPIVSALTSAIGVGLKGARGTYAKSTDL